MINSSKQTVTIIGVIAGVIVLVAVAMQLAKVPGFTETQLFEVKKSSLASSLSEDTTIRPETSIDLSFENAGKIRNILVDVGSRVKKGQLLAEEVDSDYVVALNEAIANKESLESQVDAANENIKVQKAKLNGLYKEKGAEYDKKAQKKTIDQAEAQAEAEKSLRDAAQEAVNGAQLDLAKTRILAPMDGVITDKSAEIGEVVAQASPIMNIASGNNLQAETYVSELDVKKIAVGDTAEIVLSSAAENNAAISAKIKTIYPAEKSDNGVSSYKVIFELPDQDSDLRSGLTGSAKIRLSSESGIITVPQSSVFSDAGKKYVMILAGGLPERREVQTGSYGSDGMVEIISGLSEGDKIIKF
jgi:RND family efflux transporter MFP subunit